MAKAKFHKAQRVFVKPVGTWAYVESVVPKWIRGCDEPIKIAYDCGMGREFAQEELEQESLALHNGTQGSPNGQWRVLRGQNSLEKLRAMRPPPVPWHPPHGRDHRA